MSRKRSSARPFRRAHGRSAESGRITASETPPADELKPPDSAPPAARPDRDASGRFTRGNGVGRRRKVRPGLAGFATLRKMGLEPNEAFAPFQRWGAAYARHRRAELTRVFGEVSAAVGSMCESEGLALGGSRFLYAIAACKPGGKLLVQAAALANQARAIARDAWALCALESEARRRASATANVAAFLAPGEPASAFLGDAPRRENGSAR